MTAFSGLTKEGESWIIYSRASDHMTGCEQFFSSYVPSPGNNKVKIADGSCTVVAGVGSIKLNSLITLQGVFHVPRLSCNLLSINKIRKDLNCIVNFTPSACVFQD